MKLYTNNQGQWVGTQADAKKLSGKAVQVEVPVSKPELLSFLNEKRVQYDLNQHIETFRSQPDLQKNFPQTLGDLGRKTPVPEPAMQPVGDLKSRVYPQGRPHNWTTIRECAENAPLKDLTTAIAVYMNRVDEELCK